MKGDMMVIGAIIRNEMKTIRLLLMILLVVVLSACSTQPDTTEEAPPAVEEPAGDTDTNGEELALTLDELKEYNGQDGKPAYVAVDGIIYDVTDVQQWKGGIHNGVEAGTDASDAIQGAPHGSDVLKNLKKVGKIMAE